MKSLVLALAILSVSSLAFAKTDSPVDAFRASPVIKAKISLALQQGFALDKTAGAAVLSGGCGFAGCSSSYLVTLGVSTKGTNPQTKVISAVVTLSTYSAPSVNPVSVDALLH